MNDRAFVERIRSERNAAARSALVGAFVKAKEGLIRQLTRKAAVAEKTAEDIEDLLQAGRIGFMRAIEDWNWDKGALSTWAAWKIKRCVQDAAKAAQPIALPQIRGTAEERKRVIEALHANPDATAAELGIPEGMLDRIKKTLGLRYVSVDMFGADGDDASARARRIERRITEATDDGDDEDDVDKRRCARAAVESIYAARDAWRRAAPTLRVTFEDIFTLVAHALGCEAPYPVVEKPHTKKAPPPCPSTPSFLPLRSRPTLRPARLRIIAASTTRSTKPLPRPRLRRSPPRRARLALRASPQVSLRTASASNESCKLLPFLPRSTAPSEPRLLRLCLASRAA